MSIDADIAALKMCPYLRAELPGASVFASELFTGFRIIKNLLIFRVPLDAAVELQRNQ